MKYRVTVREQFETDFVVEAESPQAARDEVLRAVVSWHRANYGILETTDRFGPEAGDTHQVDFSAPLRAVIEEDE